MKIVIPAFNRPDCLRRCIAAILGMKGFKDKSRIAVFIDSPINPDIVAVCESFGVEYLKTPIHLGCNQNIYRAMDVAFSNGHDSVLMVEEDIVLSPLAWSYFQWAADEFRHDSTVRTVSGWRHQQGWLPVGQMPHNEVGRCMRQKRFTCWSWLTWGDRWNEMKSNWTSDLNDTDEGSWDVHLTSTMGSRCEIVPSISLATNVGDGGVHRGREFVPNSSGLVDPDSDIEWWLDEGPDPSLRPVLVCSGRYGDLYQVCSSASRPSIIFTSQEFGSIVTELFPEHELFTVNKEMTGIGEMMALAKTRFPEHKIVPAQQNGLPDNVVSQFRNYEEFQRYQSKTA